MYAGDTFDTYVLMTFGLVPEVFLVVYHFSLKSNLKVWLYNYGLPKISELLDMYLGTIDIYDSCKR